jgi:uncharacterized protein involved in response to NO
MLGLPSPSLTPDAERHAIGAVFVTILILGVGAHLLPGFARRPLRSQSLTWGTLIIGNLAALLRVAPVLTPSQGFGAIPTALLAGAGLAGVIGVALFAINIHGAHAGGDYGSEFIARQIFSGVNGISRCRIPNGASASMTA